MWKNDAAGLGNPRLQAQSSWPSGRCRRGPAAPAAGKRSKVSSISRSARGDGKADLWRKRHAARYLAYGLGPIVLLVGVWYKRLWLVAVVLGGAYLVTPYRRLAPWLPTLAPMERLEALAWVPVIRLVGDVAKMLGYPAGVWWRLRRSSQPASA